MYFFNMGMGAIYTDLDARWPLGFGTIVPGGNFLHHTIVVADRADSELAKLHTGIIFIYCREIRILCPLI